MFDIDKQVIRERHDRLFELIRQQNLMNKRRRPSETPLAKCDAALLARVASDSLRPVSDLATQRPYLL